MARGADGRGGRRGCRFLLAVVVATTDREGEGRIGGVLLGQIRISVESFSVKGDLPLSPKIHDLNRCCALIVIVPQPPDEIHPIFGASQDLACFDMFLILKYNSTLQEPLWSGSGRRVKCFQGLS